MELTCITVCWSAGVITIGIASLYNTVKKLNAINSIVVPNSTSISEEHDYFDNYT